MSNDFLAAMLAGHIGKGGGNDDDSPPVAPEELTELGKRYLEKHEFKPGELVVWKKGLHNCKFPAQKAAAVVLEVCQGRRESGEKSANAEYAPSDVRVGVIARGHFEGFWLDGNRLEPYREE